MSKNETTLWRYSVDFNTDGEGNFQYKKVAVLNDSERFQTACIYMQKMLKKVYSDNDNEFHVLLSEENDELAKSLLAEKVRARHEELKALYVASNNALWFLEKEPREQKERKERADRENFAILVHFLAETWYENEEEDIEEEIITFEDAIEERGFGEAYFGAAKGDYTTGIDFSFNTCHAKFHADHYDGFSAPYCVCTWNDDFEKLEELFQETAPTVYEMYRTRLSERLPESSMVLDR